MDADIIDIQPEDYGLWYIDATSDPMKYDGKTVRFLAQAYVGKDVPAGGLVPGHFGMVCSRMTSPSSAFYSYPDRDELHNRDWVKVTAVHHRRGAAAVPRSRSGTACHHGRTRRKGEGRYRLL